MPAFTQTTTLHNPTARLLAAIVLFAITAWLSGKGTMPAWEESIFRQIYYWPPIVGPFFSVITQLGNIFVLGGLALFYLLKQQYKVMLRLLLAGSLAYLLAGVAKDLLGRPRPLELLFDVSARDFIIRGPGFPSGHAALATAIALAIGPYIPQKYRLLVPFIIISVALSRVYLGVHAPLDVVGGIAIGWACAEIVNHVEIRDKPHRRVIHGKLKRKA